MSRTWKWNPALEHQHCPHWGHDNDMLLTDNHLFLYQETQVFYLIVLVNLLWLKMKQPIKPVHQLVAFIKQCSSGWVFHPVPPEWCSWCSRCSWCSSCSRCSRWSWYSRCSCCSWCSLCSRCSWSSWCSCYSWCSHCSWCFFTDQHSYLLPFDL